VSSEQEKKVSLARSDGYLDGKNGEEKLPEAPAPVEFP